MTTKQACIWCSQDKSSDGAEGRGEAPLCGCCREHLSLPLDRPIQKYLDALLFPVLGIELYAGKRMIIRVVNKGACAWLDKEPKEIIQHLTGNVIECVHAGLPEGCGGALPCEACEVLSSVSRTLRTGESLVTVPASLHRVKDGNPVATALRLTTLKAGGMAMMRLDRR